MSASRAPRRWHGTRRPAANRLLGAVAALSAAVALLAARPAAWAAARARVLPVGLRGGGEHASVARSTAEPRGRFTRLRAEAADAQAEKWAADFVDKEIARSPVVLFVGDFDATGAARAARSALRDVARVRFELVEVDRLGSSLGPSWPELVRARLAELVATAPLPALFVHGKHVYASADGFHELATSGELEKLCEEAGAEPLAPRESTNMTWTVRSIEEGRWLPPKNINGRRWYQDDPNMESFPGEHKDPIRIEFNKFHVSPGAGRGGLSTVSPSGIQLLRQDTNLDGPNVHGEVPDFRGKGHQLPPFSENHMLMNFDWGLSLFNACKGRDVKAYYSTTLADAEREGLPLDVLRWVYIQNRPKLVEELKRRQCKAQVYTNVEVVDLRAALKDELRKEIAYSPSGLGVVPGVVLTLSASELASEREADTGVPLLVAFTSTESPTTHRLRAALRDAAKIVLRGARIVQVDCYRWPKVAAEYRIGRFPTLIWFEGRGGPEMERFAGVPSAKAIVARTRGITPPELITAGRPALKRPALKA